LKLQDIERTKQEAEKYLGRLFGRKPPWPGVLPFLQVLSPPGEIWFPAKIYPLGGNISQILGEAPIFKYGGQHFFWGGGHPGLKRAWGPQREVFFVGAKRVVFVHTTPPIWEKNVPPK